MDKKIKISFQKHLNTNEVNKLNQIVEVKVKDKHNKLRKIYVHGYLVGLELANYERAKNKNQSIVLCIGSVGVGKSSLIKGLSGLNATIRNSRLTLDNYSWTTDDFCKKYHDEDFFGMPQVFDESIDGIGKLNNTKKGEKLKKTVVTGRFQLHTSYLLVDEVQEFHPKLVRMADILIRVRRFGNKRGYWEAYTDKRKIRFIYNGLKYYGKTWSSPEIKRILPDSKGKFPDYSNIFFDDEDYDKAKLEQTREDEEKESPKELRKKRIEKMVEQGMTHQQIGDIEGVNRSRITQIVNS